MDAKTLKDAKADLEKLMDEAVDNHEPVIITREGKSPVVLVSLADWNSQQETEYLLRSPANRARLEDDRASKSSAAKLSLRPSRNSRNSHASLLRAPPNEGCVFEIRLGTVRALARDRLAQKLKKINALLKDCLRNPFEGIGRAGAAQARLGRLVVPPHRQGASPRLSRCDARRRPGARDRAVPVATIDLRTSLCA